MAPLAKQTNQQTKILLRTAPSTSLSDPTQNISWFILVEFVYLFSPISVFLSLILDNNTTICSLPKGRSSPSFILGFSRETPKKHKQEQSAQKLAQVQIALTTLILPLTCPEEEIDCKKIQIHSLLLILD